MPKAVVVPKEKAEETLKLLKKMNLIDRRYKVTRIGDYVYIPVVREVEGLEVKDVELEEREGSTNLKKCIEKKLGKGEWPRSFSVVGDIALISLNDPELLKYKDVIAECIMKVQKNVKSVWAKLGTEGETRTARLVYLGGENRTETVYTEHGLRFKVDLAKVYVNPSLAHEHSEVAKIIREGEKVLDMFAGAGFFSMHIASRVSAEVVAIDVNPYAIKCMIDSIELNKKKLKGTVIPILSDARTVTRYFKDKSFDVVIMNLPHKTHEFLDVAKRLARRLIILYTVGKEEEVKEKFKGFRTKKVLDYSPYKFIWRVEIPA